MKTSRHVPHNQLEGNMSIDELNAKVLDIIKAVDYDMWKEAKAEPEEWVLPIREIENILIDVFNEGYRFAEVDYDVANKY